ncbi:MAG: sterol desaturase family protein [Rhodospirillaceae bacterium]
MDVFLRDNAESLQYLIFFSLFAGLGLMELWLTDKPAARGIRWRSNLMLTVLCVLTLGVLPVSALMAADYAAERGTGLLNDPLIPAGLAIAAGILLRSLLSYMIHIAFHKAPWLWRLHAVHHTDTDMDVTTAVRMHPVEFIISAALILPCVVAFGIPVEAVILYEILDSGMAVFTHTNVRLPKPVDRALRWGLVTPAMHRIHHSNWQAETDSNFGATFSFWDRMFGTYRATARDGEAPTHLGLESVSPQQSESIAWLLALPLAGLPVSQPNAASTAEV